ncbi:YchO/YchP family invasin [Kluyvera georgiana]|uniref:YchO/YchP family invasin n=1 Tax=Kluyvera georgiana TaxID=73098 RepID=UPI002304AE54|nr:YchO/YchP family invasin [Kluyvera georgiana]MDA8495477.1 YchO/YchP family invasin [Kluyvera georgiana]
MSLRFYSSFFVLLVLASGGARARQSFIEEAEHPFDNLPDLGIAPESRDSEKQFAEMVKSFGEASMTDNGLDTGEQARLFALTQVQEKLNSEVNQQLGSWLSPWGNTDFQMLVDEKGKFTGSHGSWFVPLQDNTRYLTWTQIGLSQQDEGTVGNLGVGQRWVAGRWLLGYNTFYDSLLDADLNRGGIGAEAWGENLRFSANYYHPLHDWENSGTTLQQRMARGYDVTAQAWIPAWNHINTSLSVEQYFGDSVDLFRSGTGYHNPVAVSLGLNYTPIPLLTFSAQHKQGESGVNQNNLGMKANFRFGVPLKKQLAADEVAQTRTLRGSRYDAPERNSLPVMEYRQRKSLTVYLATPPWNLSSYETVELKLQIHDEYGVKSLTWQGDTTALSLTPPASNNSTDGWSIIMPAWDYTQGASNTWHLSVVVVDKKGQRVTSNEITLALTEPVVSFAPMENGWSGMTP